MNPTEFSGGVEVFEKRWDWHGIGSDANDLRAVEMPMEWRDNVIVYI